MTGVNAGRVPFLSVPHLAGPRRPGRGRPSAVGPSRQQGVGVSSRVHALQCPRAQQVPRMAERSAPVRPPGPGSRVLEDADTGSAKGLTDPLTLSRGPASAPKEALTARDLLERSSCSVILGFRAGGPGRWCGVRAPLRQALTSAWTGRIRPSTGGIPATGRRCEWSPRTGSVRARPCARHPGRPDPAHRRARWRR